MEVFSINCIFCDEINENFDFEWQNTQFGYYVENNSYVPVNLDEDYLEDLRDDYEWAVNHEADDYVNRLRNTITFIEAMRDREYRGKILVYCYW